MFNEDLAPYGYDDLEYAIRATLAGYQNAVFSIPFRSDVHWGGSRRPGHPDVQPVVQRNAAYIREHNAWELKHIVNCEQLASVERVMLATPAEDAAAILRWQESRAVLREMNP